MSASKIKNNSPKPVLGEVELKQLAKKKVMAWCNHNTEEKYKIGDVYVVWQCYILGNWKAMLSTSHSGDGLYFEATYNKAKKELYLDVYGKKDNVKFKDVK